MTGVTEPAQQPLITAIFDASREAVSGLADLLPDLDRDRCEYAVADSMFREVFRTR